MNEWETREPLLDDLIRLVRRGLLPAVLAALLAGAATYYLVREQPPTYEAGSTVIAAQVDPEFSAFGLSTVTTRPLSANAYRTAVQSSPVLASALSTRNPDGVSGEMIDELRGRLSVETDVDPVSTLINIRVRDRTPEAAATMVSAVTNAFLAWDATRAQNNLNLVISTLEEQVEALDEQLRGLDPAAEDFENQRVGMAALRAQQQTQLASVRALRNSAVGALEIIEPATIPSDPVAPRPLRAALIVAVVAALLVYGILLLREAVSRRLTSSDELARLTGLPVLAVFEKSARGGAGISYDALTYLRTNLLHATLDAHPKEILITGACSGEGKSAIAMGLAESFARNGQRTLLVDADMRQPMIGAAYGIKARSSRSLNAQLRTSEGAGGSAQQVALTQANFDVVHSEKAEGSSTVEMLDHGFERLLEAWRPQYDVIVIDTPPLLYFADALTIAPQCTGAVLVVNKPTGERKEVRSAVDLLQRVDARVLGTVMTGASDDETRRRGRDAYVKSQRTRLRQPS